MVIMTAKVSKRKILLIGLLIILAVVVLITCLKKSSGSDTPPDTAEEITEVATNEARVAFLEQFGWEVQQEPVQTQQVRVPEDPSEVFLRYNDLQQSQGYDLLSYSGKTLTRYVGVMHGFSMPAAQPSSGAFFPESEEISENLS